MKTGARQGARSIFRAIDRASGGRAGELGAGSDRAGHAGTAEPAIAERVLGEILLVIVLGEIEFRRLGGLLLLRREGVDAGTVLRADVVALPHALRRVVAFPEHLEQRLVGNLLR